MNDFCFLYTYFMLCCETTLCLQYSMIYMTAIQFKTKDTQWCFLIQSISISKVDELKFNICSCQTCCHLYKN